MWATVNGVRTLVICTVHWANQTVHLVTRPHPTVQAVQVYDVNTNDIIDKIHV